MVTRDGVKYRSKFEASIGHDLILHYGKALLMYEALKLDYVRPQTSHKYTPDFILPNGIALEIKGWMDLEGRKRYVNIVNSNPGLDLRFIIQSKHTKIRKGSKTTLQSWCINNGIPCAIKTCPPEWMSEPMNLASLSILFPGNPKPKAKKKGKT